MAPSHAEQPSDDTVGRDTDGLYINEEGTNLSKNGARIPHRRLGMTYEEDGNELVTLDLLQACNSAAKTSRDETDEDITHAQLQVRFDEAMRPGKQAVVGTSCSRSSSSTNPTMEVSTT